MAQDRLITLEAQRRWEAANRERSQARKRAWRERNIEKARAYSRAWRQRNREKKQAHNILWQALLAGTMIRPLFCDLCGSGKNVQAHHADYSKPLDVDWVCASCHGLTHQRWGKEHP